MSPESKLNVNSAPSHALQKSVPNTEDKEFDALRRTVEAARLGEAISNFKRYGIAARKAAAQRKIMEDTKTKASTTGIELAALYDFQVELDMLCGIANEGDPIFERLANGTLSGRVFVRCNVRFRRAYRRFGPDTSDEHVLEHPLVDGNWTRFFKVCSTLLSLYEKIKAWVGESVNHITAVQAGHDWKEHFSLLARKVSPSSTYTDYTAANRAETLTTDSHRQDSDLGDKSSEAKSENSLGRTKTQQSSKFSKGDNETVVSQSEYNFAIKYSEAEVPKAFEFIEGLDRDISLKKKGWCNQDSKVEEEPAKAAQDFLREIQNLLKHLIEPLPMIQTSRNWFGRRIDAILKKYGKERDQQIQPVIAEQSWAELRDILQKMKTISEAIDRYRGMTLTPTRQDRASPRLGSSSTSRKTPKNVTLTFQSLSFTDLDSAVTDEEGFAKLCKMLFDPVHSEQSQCKESTTAQNRELSNLPSAQGSSFSRGALQ